MKNINWANVQEAKGGSFERLAPGGYICRIVSVEDRPEKEYLYVIADVEEGEHKHIGKTAELLSGNDWSYIKFYRSYKPKAEGIFKSFLVALEKSNPGKFSWQAFDGDEKKLEGLLIGLVLGEEEYRAQDGTVKVRVRMQYNTSVRDIQANNFRVPTLKKLREADAEPAVAGVSASDLPF